MSSRISIRPIRPDDVDRLQSFHQRLSPEAIRLRFHGYLKELPDEMARRFCNVDGRDRVAYVAVNGEPEHIVGVGRYDREDQSTAEVAFVVEDAFQHQGLGTALLQRLIASAHSQHIRFMAARVLHGNSPMRRLLERTGYPVTVLNRGGTDLLQMDISRRRTRE